MKHTVFLIVFLAATTSLAERYQNGHAEFRNSSLHNNSYNNSYDKGIDVAVKVGFFASVLHAIFGESEATKKEKQFAKDRNWLDIHYGRYDSNDFLKHFDLRPYGCGQWSYEWTVHQDPIFNKFEFYRFSEFRHFLRGSESYRSRIAELKREILQGKVFELSSCTHDEFKSAVFEMAAEFQAPYEQEFYSWSPPVVIEQPSDPIQEIKKVDPIQVEQALKRDQITAIMQRPENDLMAHYAWYQDIEINELSQPVTAQEQFLIKRVDALTEFEQGTVSWREETYTISTDVSNLLVAQRIEVQSYTLLYGNQVQHVLHSEILSILGDTALLHYGPIANECKDVTKTLTRFADAGKKHNEVGHVKNACQFADFCWGVLDCIKDAYAFECELENAVGRGVLNGRDRFIEKVKDPIKTIRDMRNNLRSLGYLVYELTEKAKRQVYLSIKARLPESSNELLARLQGKYIPPPVKEKSLKEIVRAFRKTQDYVDNIIEIAWHHATRENILYTAEEGTAIATEMALQHATFSALSSLATNGSTALKGIIDAGHGPHDFMDLPLRVNSMEAAISYEAAIAADRAAAVEAAGQALGVGLDKAAKFAPLAVFSQNGSGGDGSNIPVGGGNPPMDIIQAMQYPTEAELAEASKYIQQVTHNGHLVTPPFIHTWVASIAKDGNITGFHQDRMGFYRKLGLIRNVRMHPEGFYTADVYCNGIWIERSFMPENWSTEELMKCYYEVIKTPSKYTSGGGRTHYRFKRDSGIIISVIVEDSTGKGISFFPNLLKVYE